jgi:hypothetical protein
MRKWDIWYIWCHDLPTPDNKYCICLCPDNKKFCFISSEPPRARRAREFAIEVTVPQCPILRWTSFIDTTSIILLHPNDVGEALADPARHKGQISPTLKRRIREAVISHGVLNGDEEALVQAD